MAVESTSRYFSYREATLIAPPDSENERVSCCCQKTCWPKAKKRGASRDVHARYTGSNYLRTHDHLGAGRGREYEGN